VICPDLNLLLYTVNEDFPHHDRAKLWWDDLLSGARPVGLLHVVVLGFIRLATHRKVFQQPLSLQQAVGVVDSWLAQPNVKMVAPAESHWETLKAMLEDGQAAANLTTDAHIAAMAADYGMIVHSNDSDFARFPGVKTVNPLAI
jgi:toxin-antitoxin system PIN domain toxin